LALLQTVNLTLRPCCSSDRADFIALERDTEVMRFLNGGKAVDQEQSDPDAMFLMPRGTEPYVWTARHKTNDSFVGWFCLWPASETVGELGYRLSRQHWGQGFATEGTAALINWGFCHGGYDRIFASTLVGNHASRRVLEKIGMHYARRVDFNWPQPFPGSEEGEVEYVVMRTEWIFSQKISKSIKPE
jgi:RimJ/RimL family protein N-acetyltransferase